MMLGNQLLPALSKLNTAFGGDPSPVQEHATQFELGKKLGPALGGVLKPSAPELGNLLEAYVATVPPAFQEAIRAIIHYALTAKPRALITFAWAPAYDFELNIWEIVEPAPASPGITILLKSRYPDHAERFAAK